MKILHVAAEVAPFAKVGGLADVAGALPGALRGRGHDARVLMPAYAMILGDPRWRAEAVASFPVAMNPRWAKAATLYRASSPETGEVWLVGTDEWFGESVDSETVYRDGGVRYAFLARAAFAACEAMGWIPDVLHAHDWHTGFVPVLLKEDAGAAWAGTRSVFTIHNLAYQGEFGIEALEWFGLSRSLFNHHQVEAHGRVNFLKAGCAYADRANTVSPTYAEGILTPEYGCGLDGLMRHLREEGRLAGVLNGIDARVFDPATDPAIPANYSAGDLSGKAACRTALAGEIGFPDDGETMLTGMVTRLASQKGLDLVLAAAERWLRLPVRLVVQGLGEAKIAAGLRELEARHPGRVRLVERFDAALAQRVYAGCDAFLMPSAFEPCGLGQLIAMRYGTVPIVRATGGLADTVFEGENGFTFARRSGEELVGAIARAALAFEDRERWAGFVARGMAHPSGWEVPAGEYEGLYRSALSSSLSPLAASF